MSVDFNNQILWLSLDALILVFQQHLYLLPPSLLLYIRLNSSSLFSLSPSIIFLKYCLLVVSCVLLKCPVGSRLRRCHLGLDWRWCEEVMEVETEKKVGWSDAVFLQAVVKRFVGLNFRWLHWQALLYAYGQQRSQKALPYLRDGQYPELKAQLWSTVNIIMTILPQNLTKFVSTYVRT